MTTSPQYERDLRSANKEWKRTKDSSVKWSHGSRHLHGIKSHDSGGFENGANAPECMFTKSRPNKRPSETNGNLYKNTQNIIKFRSAWDMPDGRRRAKAHAHSEIRDAPTSSASLLDNSPVTSPSLARAVTASAIAADPFAYSFDRADSPGRPLTLEVFVKNTGGRETEKLVEREYEVLDGNGEAVRGRKARAFLRREGTEAEEGGGGGREDEGFELV